MAHLVQTMAYANGTPWHGIGKQLTPKQPLEVWAKEAGMDWTINEGPVRYIADGSRRRDGTMIFPEQKVLYRSDTKSALSVVSHRYQVVQPREILEFYRDLTEKSGFELETAGVMKEGKKLWALAKTSQTANLKGNDVINGYLLLATACDGTLATTAQFTSVRVVCANTLAVALANGTGVVKVPHSTSFNPEAVKKQLGISAFAWDEFMYRMKTLSERKIKTQEAPNYFKHLLTDQTSADSGQFNDRAMKKLMALFDGEAKGSDLASARSTAFGLLNAVTEYVDHERRARSVDHRLESAWFGAGAVLKQKALDQALAMVG